MSAPPSKDVQRNLATDITSRKDQPITQAVAPSNNKIKLAKTLAVEIKGTLNGFNMIGPDAATWRPLEGKQAQIFGLDHLEDVGEAHTMGTDAKAAAGSLTMQADLSSAMQSLKNATITKATLLQSHNTFPVPLGVTVSCLPRHEVVDTGDKYTFTTIPQTTCTHPQVLFEQKECTTDASAWQEAFPTFNRENLTTQGVLNMPACPFVFINEKHPVVNLLRINSETLGVNIDAQQKMDDEWYKVSRPLMETCCDTIKNKVLKDITPHEKDLTSLCVQLHRLGGADWSHIDSSDLLQTFVPDPSWDNVTLKANMSGAERNFTEKPGVFLARLHLEYEIPKPG